LRQLVEVRAQMLTEFLEELRPQLQRRIEARIAASRANAPQPAVPGRRVGERLPALLNELISALRTGRVAEAPCGAHCGLGSDVEAWLNELALVQACIYDLIEERGLRLGGREIRVLAEWFGAHREIPLRKANRRFAEMLDALPDHVFLVDTAGRKAYINRSAREHFGAALGTRELLGRTPTDLGLPAELLQAVDAGFARALDGETVSLEARFPSVDGMRWRQTLASPVRGADGSVEAVAVVSRDTHARKSAEARLQLMSKVGTLAETMEYESVLSAVARLSIPELADWCIVDAVENGKVRRGKVAHGDPGKAALAEELLRFPPDYFDSPWGRQILAGKSQLIAEVSNDRMCDRVPNRELQEIIRRLGARSMLIVPFVVMGTTVAVATFVVTPESQRRHEAEDLALAEELARRAAQIIENARLHDQLQKSEARFRFALAHSNIAVFEEDTDFRIRWMYNSQLGSEPGDAPCKSNADLFDGAASEQLTALKRGVLDTGERVRTEVDTVVAGVLRHLLVSYEALRDQAGAIVGLTGSAVDMTEAKRAQEELAQALAFREQMMGVLGHDLRNPVSAVHGLSSLLLVQDGLPESARRGLTRIDQSARRMNEMIETVLDFTHSRFRGGLPIARQDVDLHELCRLVVDELGVAHPGREIRLGAAGDLRGQWDPARMAQVISNLVGNALTHGDHEAPVELSLAADNARVSLEVTNRGPAISPDVVERLFEPFRQGQTNAEAPRTRGLGLGLYIAREIVLAHGGTIQVRSTDESTTFAVHLER
jgi:PAS domain S-box-containing protein